MGKRSKSKAVARRSRKRAGALLKGFPSLVFEDKRRKAERKKPARKDLLRDLD